MLKKILLFTFLACMSIASSCLAAQWIKIGTATEWWYEAAEEQKFLDTTGRNYYYDADDIIIDKDRKIIIFTEAVLDSKTSIESLTDEFKIHRRKMDLSTVRINGNRRFDVVTLADGYYNPRTDKFRVTDKYRGNFMGAAWDAQEYKGRYYRGNVLYREFAPLLNMPNLDGNTTVTPKSLGLTWIKSTSEVGVFYYPKTVKVKGNTVSAKISVWIPSINRFEELSGKFDYDKNTFKPNNAEFYRISSGELVESHRRGLIPGLVGEALHTFRFDEDDSIKIASDFFKSKLAQ